jgi:hypothetical protein
MRRTSFVWICLFCLAVFSMAFLQGCDKKPSFNTPYQVVLLDNGQAYFGKVEKLDTYLTLTDIYYVQTQGTPEGKVAGMILVKRGKEWHAPDRMYVNASHIIMIEPVAPDSRVAQLIKEEKERPMETKK